MKFDGWQITYAKPANEIEYIQMLFKLNIIISDSKRLGYLWNPVWFLSQVVKEGQIVDVSIFGVLRKVVFNVLHLWASLQTSVSGVVAVI